MSVNSTRSVDSLKLKLFSIDQYNNIIDSFKGHIERLNYQ
jgi:hypothetical protein